MIYGQNINNLFHFLEPPVMIIKRLSDVRCEDGSSVTLECELSRQNVDVKWQKVQQHIHSALLNVYLLYIHYYNVHNSTYITLIFFLV